MNLGVIGYVPPPRVGNPQVFLQNLAAYPPQAPLILFSNHDWPSQPFPMVKWNFNPEMYRLHSNHFALKNLIFFKGLSLAIKAGWSHLLWLEEDCRVRAGWDEALQKEYQSEWTAAGTLFIINPYNGGPEAAQRCNELVAKYNQGKSLHFPVCLYGNKGVADNTGSCVAPNGALAIYDIQALKSLFGAVDIHQTATKIKAWDRHIGDLLWAKYGAGVYDQVGILKSEYSGFGDVINGEVERQVMLMNQEVVAVHQIKSNWQPGKEVIQTQAKPNPPQTVMVAPPIIAPPITVSLHAGADLSKVTIYAIWWSEANEQFTRTIRVLNYCRKHFNTYEVVLFCYPEPTVKTEARVVRIPKLNFNDYNLFVNREVVKQIQSEFALSVHEDGFPIRPELWDKDFLAYDYIGSPWADGVVGNGGFSISSKKLMESVVSKIKPGISSDLLVCRHLRASLEKEGMRFAPKDIALKFSTETIGNDVDSFGFHGRKNRKYKEGWNVIKRLDYGIGNVDLIYVMVLNNEHYFKQAKRFVDTYVKFPPNHDHRTIIVCNCGTPGQKEKQLFKPLPNVSFYQHDNSGYDIGSFIAVAKKSKADLIVCFGSDAHFWRPGWLARMVEARIKHGPGVYGSNTSFQEMPHLNTTSFWCDPSLLASYPWPVVNKKDRYSFEQDKYRLDRPFWMYVHSLGKKSLFVTWDGEYEWRDWRKPPNIFRRGNQSNMLIHWKWSDHWRDCNPGEKQWVSFVTDTLTLDPFNPDTFMNSSFFDPKTPQEKDWIIRAFKELEDGRLAMKKSQTNE